jgi:hypothetical protein
MAFLACSAIAGRPLSPTSKTLVSGMGYGCDSFRLYAPTGYCGHIETAMTCELADLAVFGGK